jgi:hypothetical protein
MGNYLQMSTQQQVKALRETASHVNNCVLLPNRRARSRKRSRCTLLVGLPPTIRCWVRGRDSPSSTVEVERVQVVEGRGRVPVVEPSALTPGFVGVNLCGRE